MRGYRLYRGYIGMIFLYSLLTTSKSIHCECYDCCFSYLKTMEVMTNTTCRIFDVARDPGIPGCSDHFGCESHSLNS